MPYTVSKTVSDDTLNRIITIESGGNPNSRASTSSALGLGQFLNATWLATVKAHAPSVMTGKSQSQVLALRTDPSFSIEMLARFTEDNQRVVGMDCEPGDLYLAHFLGTGVARSLFRAQQSTPVSRYVSADAIRANRSVLEGKTVAQVRTWAAKRMKQSGGRNWVAKYYRPVARPVAAVGDLPDTMHPAGGVDLLSVQSQLRGMNYYTGLLDGLWGSKTASAISGFINDRGGFMSAPTSLAQYGASLDKLKPELDRAESEGFRRPVTNARIEQDPATVAKIAPEIIPARRSMWATMSGGVLTFVVAVWDTVASWSETVWNFVTNNKDNIPASVTDPSVIEKVFHAVPTQVWLFALAALLAFIGVNAYRSVRKINDVVSTGER